jgi:nicotinamidase-related amidase
MGSQFYEDSPPNPEQSALLVVDMQKFFFEENPEIDQRSLVANCQEAISISRQARMPIIHIVTVYRQDRADWPAPWRAKKDAWCSNLVEGNELSKTVDGIDIQPEDLVVVKKRFSAFYNTNLDDLLRSRNRNHLYSIGYAANVCIRFTLADAFNRDYGVSIIEEGVESSPHESKERSIQYLGWFIEAERITLEDYRDRMQTVRAAERLDARLREGRN